MNGMVTAFILFLASACPGWLPAVELTRDDPRFSDHVVQIHIYRMGSHSTRLYSSKTVREERSVYMEISGTDDVNYFDKLIGYGSTLGGGGKRHDLDQVWPNIVIDYLDANGKPRQTFLSDGCDLYLEDGLKLRKLGSEFSAWLESITMLKGMECIDSDRKPADSESP